LGRRLVHHEREECHTLPRQDEGRRDCGTLPTQAGCQCASCRSACSAPPVLSGLTLSSCGRSPAAGPRPPQAQAQDLHLWPPAVARELPPPYRRRRAADAAELQPPRPAAAAAGGGAEGRLLRRPTGRRRRPCSSTPPHHRPCDHRPPRARLRLCVTAGLFRPITSRDLRHAVRPAAARRLTNSDKNILAAQPRNHIGFHPLTRQRLTQHPDFTSYLRALKDAAPAVLAGPAEADLT
jgi:hypothetical protein